MKHYCGLKKLEQKKTFCGSNSRSWGCRFQGGCFTQRHEQVLTRWRYVVLQITIFSFFEILLYERCIFKKCFSDIGPQSSQWYQTISSLCFSGHVDDNYLQDGATNWTSCLLLGVYWYQRDFCNREKRLDWSVFVKQNDLMSSTKTLSPWTGIPSALLSDLKK